MNKMTDFTELPKKIADRVKGQVYIHLRTFKMGQNNLIL